MQRDVTRWNNVGESIPVCGRLIYSSSEVPISRINTEGVVKRIRRIADSPTDPDSERSVELDGEEVVVVPQSVGQPSSTSSSQPLASRFQSQVIPSTPRTFQPVLASIPTTLPPHSPSPSHDRPAFNKAVRPSPIQQPWNSPIPPPNNLSLWPVAVEEEMDFRVCHFLLLKSFKEEIVGISKLPEKIQTPLVNTIKLWPDYSGELIEIPQRLLCMQMIELFQVLLQK
ncbi:hypothetical protein O181_064177 [Austropuccinia psidii MF-1]|uniref:Uncharacterized protein n=1 Tax=Austropuccinia psidii MF-1 TaxID=1389203 RepID=A0A9Q3EV99_9BASI|nr:hypothetical protein [Austropuccinia psidii MF-1]